jgi:hypothetical protein
VSRQWGGGELSCFLISPTTAALKNAGRAEAGSPRPASNQLQIFSAEWIMIRVHQSFPAQERTAMTQAQSCQELMARLRARGPEISEHAFPCFAPRLIALARSRSCRLRCRNTYPRPCFNSVFKLCQRGHAYLRTDSTSLMAYRQHIAQFPRARTASTSLSLVTDASSPRSVPLVSVTSVGNRRRSHYGGI